MDGWVGGFAEQALDWRSLAAMTAGGTAYRMGRIGAPMEWGSGNAFRTLSVGAGLTAEVSAFEMTHRGLTTLSHRGAPTNHGESNLWRWSGPGGIRQGLFQSFIAFGAIKGAGRIAREENIVIQHLLQDGGMVLGHQGSGILGITPRPTGTLAEQFLHAEAMNLQIGAGMALAYRFAPGIHSLDRGLDLSIQSTNGGRFPSTLCGGRTPPLQIGPQPEFSISGASGENGALRPVPEIKIPSILQMTSEEGGGGGSGDPFSSWIQRRRDTASPERGFASEEILLLNELERAPWEDRWDLLGRLRNIYVRNMTKKGIEGLHSLRELYRSVNEYVRENNLFHLLLVRTDQGKLYFHSTELQPPFAFRALSAFPPDPVIYTNGSADPGLGYQAYFAIDRLVLAQDVVSEEKVKEIMENWGRKPLPPVFLAFDSERDFYHLRDGYHRLVAASRLGYTHVRGLVKERLRLSSAPIPLSQIRPVPPDEFARIARERNYGIGESIGSILLNSKDED